MQYLVFSQMQLNPPARSMIPIFLLFSIFIINQIAQNMGVSSHFTSSYLDDLICFPIVFFIVQWVHRRRINENFILPLSHIFVGVLFFSLIFEIILPMVSSRYIGDFYDVGFYFIGATIFYLINTSNLQSFLTPTPPDG